MADSRIVDQYGRPIQYDKLTEELAAARTTGIRQVWHQSVASGLTPGRLANILQAAAEGSAHHWPNLRRRLAEYLPAAGVSGRWPRTGARLGECQWCGLLPALR
ncbi:hypothetical protein [Pseudomonas hormoni]